MELLVHQSSPRLPASLTLARPCSSSRPVSEYKHAWGLNRAELRHTDAFDAYQNVTGAVLDPTTGLLRLTPDQFANLQSLFFQIGDVSACYGIPL